MVDSRLSAVPPEGPASPSGCACALAVSKEEIDDSREMRILGRRDPLEPLRGSKVAKGGLESEEGSVD